MRPKSRRRAPARRGRMFRGDQTRYHQEWVGFSKTLIYNGNDGLITTFAPQDSAGFLQRFQDWRAYRVIGWNCTLQILKTNDQVDAPGLTGFAPFNQSLLGSATLVSPVNLPSLLELPNCKTIPIAVSNPRSKANFAWFNRKGDINALPFQSIEALQTAEYATGLISFTTSPQPIVYEVYGKLLVQFKDKNIFNVNNVLREDNVTMENPISPTVKRLGRVFLNN